MTATRDKTDPSRIDLDAGFKVFFVVTSERSYCVYCCARTVICLSVQDQIATLIISPVSVAKEARRRVDLTIILINKGSIKNPAYPPLDTAATPTPADFENTTIWFSQDR